MISKIKQYNLCHCYKQILKQRKDIILEVYLKIQAFHVELNLLQFHCVMSSDAF
jgi:hypothetical protein